MARASLRRPSTTFDTQDRASPPAFRTHVTAAFCCSARPISIASRLHGMPTASISASQKPDRDLESPLEHRGENKPTGNQQQEHPDSPYGDQHHATLASADEEPTEGKPVKPLGEPQNPSTTSSTSKTRPGVGRSQRHSQATLAAKRAAKKSRPSKGKASVHRHRDGTSCRESRTEHAWGNRPTAEKHRALVWIG